MTKKEIILLKVRLCEKRSLLQAELEEAKIKSIEARAQIERKDLEIDKIDRQIYELMEDFEFRDKNPWED